MGVEYKVEVSKESFGDFAPYNKAPSHMTINAKKVEVEKQNINKIGEENKTNLKITHGDVLFTNKEIHNSDQDLL